MQQAILDLIARLGGGVSFIELCQRVEGFAGPHACTLNGHVVLWQGVSDAGIEALSQLQANGQIAFVACSPLVYLIDGQMLRLPIAKRHPPATVLAGDPLPARARPRPHGAAATATASAEGDPRACPTPGLSVSGTARERCFSPCC